MSPYEPTIVASYGSWQLVEGLTGRSLRRRRRGPSKPHLLMGGAAIAFAVLKNLAGELADGPASIVIGFGTLVVLMGARLSLRASKELRFGATELTWATVGEVAGTRWRHADLSHVELFEPLKNLPPGMARRTKARYQVSIETKKGEALPIVITLFDARAAADLAGRIAASTGLDVATRGAKPDGPAFPRASAFR